ncbi:FecR family protein [Neolewinella xylanilytica]|uniref:FecR family protein n=1 Tax=Neolewinella xylanilytica TaxID=1514080 RepID=A0A2S6I8M0_9BACT|nr:FecR domain-containing protein [Neolewinella xylanilytica]PPK87847.1 FecR family protein [Neolewinella xylanilytica]
MDPQAFRQLLEKFASGTASEAEREQVERFYAKLQSRRANTIVPTDGETERRIADRIRAKLTEAPRRRRWKPWYPIAAGFALVVGLAALLPLRSGNDTITVVTQDGERRELALADGSTVDLEGAASITFPADFAQRRHVTLRGEAFFDVARDTLHPFTVVTGPVITRVLGTSFTIKQKGADVVVSVVSGTVRTVAEGSDGAILTKGQRIRYRAGRPLFPNQNLILLSDTPLHETAQLLARRYGVRIDLAPGVAKDRRLSGKFRDEALEHVLTSLAILADLEIEYLEPDHILIKNARPD